MYSDICQGKQLAGDDQEIWFEGQNWPWILTEINIIKTLLENRMQKMYWPQKKSCN